MKESDIRPKDLYAMLLELNRRDVERFFADRSGLVAVDCPACDSAVKSDGLVKLGFQYAVCDDCGSLYLTPRPTLAAMDRFYREAESVKFWGTEFYRQTEASRRKRMFRPRAQLAARLADDLRLSSSSALADIGPGYGIFLEEVAATGRFGSVTGIEPAANLAGICRDKGFAIIEKLAEHVAEGEVAADVLTCFEVLEHVADSQQFVAALRRCLRPGGVVLATTLTVSGFDIQVLWEHANAIYPPHHANLLSVEGYRRLFERSGFAIVELITPGELDLDIVRNKLADEPTLPLPRFVRTLVAAPDETRQKFQDFLKRSQLSSHIRIVARRV
ncbi:MAG TPA: class I SAM-dependent methyltransferase [Stellaceae bacterium]|nr:class I SAM-dependent methyltransferase [Stellaceae bacterium]